MKRSHLMLASILIIALGIVGCGTQPSPPAPASSQSSTKQDGMNPSGSAIHIGVTQMLNISADLKKAIDEGNAAKVKETGPRLEDAWRPFEDSVKQKYPDLYKKVEDALDPTIAGSKASPLDKQTLTKLNDDLNQVLTELASNEK